MKAFGIVYETFANFASFRTEDKQHKNNGLRSDTVENVFFNNTPKHTQCDYQCDFPREKLVDSIILSLTF